jgi:isopentenyl-diphosphate Delta-isomerase
MTNGPAPTREDVVVVDAHGRPAGRAEKLAAHAAPGMPHLAFSVVLFDAAGRLLLQRRAEGKYHFAGQWSNACCSHPRPGEDVVAAAHRRLAEELGVSTPALERVGAFWYRAEDAASGLVEHEYDVVLRGDHDGGCTPDALEVAETAWVTPARAREFTVRSPEMVTPWLAQVLEVALGP